MEPVRRIRSKWFYAKSMKASVTGDVRRLKQMKQRGKGQLQAARGKMQQAHAAQSQFQSQSNHVNGMGHAGMAGGRMTGQPGFGGGAPSSGGAGYAGAPGSPGAPGANPGYGGAPGGPGGPPGMGMPGGAPVRGRIKRCGFLWLRRQCLDCQNVMEKGWDQCPYCNAAQEPAPAAPPQPQRAPKTQAFQLNAAGSGNSNMALLGWLVPVRGPQRGELFTLASESLVGTDPACTVVLQDSFMSSRHCEIKAEGGQWILKDLGSTNGTFVNDKRVDRHELVDSDFVKVGQSLLKFKCL